MELTDYEKDIFRLLELTLCVNEIKNSGQKEVGIEQYESLLETLIDFYKKHHEIYEDYVKRAGLLDMALDELKSHGIIK